MPRVLLAWEFGGGLGHVIRMLVLARGLRERGHEPLLAFADLGALGALGDDFPTLAAPWLARPAVPDTAPLNASDILLNLGFGDAAGVAAALTAWAGTLRLWRPQVLVADYAPTALLAARVAGLPRVSVGSGFSQPPRGDPMPALRPWHASDPEVLQHRDSKLLATVRVALARAHPGAIPPTSAGELFTADADLVCSWPELDPFGTRADVEYLGPQDEDAGSVEVTWRSAARPRLFAYLQPSDARFRAVLGAINAVGGEAIVAAPALAPGGAEALSTPTMRVVDVPVAVDPLLSTADLFIGHGGASLSAAALAHGVPQAIVAQHLEQTLVARRLRDAGCATVLEPGEPATDLVPFLRGALAEALRQGAAAARPAQRTSISAVDRIAQLLER